MTFLSKLSALAFAAFVASASFASAATLTPEGTTCSINDIDGSTACEGAYSGNASNTIPGNTYFGKTWTQINKAESNNGWDGGIISVTEGAGGTSGKWELTKYAGYTDYMIAIKGGPTFSVYLMDGTTLMGDWNTDGILTGGQNPKSNPGLSNLTIWGSGDSSVIPLPAGAWLMLTGLAAFGFARRRAS